MYMYMSYLHEYGSGNQSSSTCACRCARMETQNSVPAAFTGNKTAFAQNERAHTHMHMDEHMDTIYLIV